MNWLILVTSLPTENATLRQRVWRSLKGAGAAVLRDGVYLLPARPACEERLQTLAADVGAAGGTALVLPVEEAPGAAFAARFDRQADYLALLGDVAELRAALAGTPPSDALRQARRLRRTMAAVAETDYFPGAAQSQAEAALAELELAVARAQSADEPQPAAGDLALLDAAQHQGRLWATRARPWVDRLASAWLIRRCIDPQAHFVWLASPADCPPDALGFDFDGAAFSHVGQRVTFEVLLARFGLTDPALARLGRIVHHLDVGGVQPAEAAGVEGVLAGLRAAYTDDDELLAQASHVFDGLHRHFTALGDAA